MEKQNLNFIDGSKTSSKQFQPEQLVEALSGKWHLSYGVAQCPVCQPQMRNDQNALTVNVRNGKLLLHCKKGGCDFKDILVAAGISSGVVEIDQMVIEASEIDRATVVAKSKARAGSLWGYGDLIHGTKGEAYLRAMGLYCKKGRTMTFSNELKSGIPASEKTIGEGLYVLRLDDGPSVKRLQQDYEGGVYIKSDNPAYDTVHVTKKAMSNLTIIGKVEWVGRRL